MIQAEFSRINFSLHQFKPLLMIRFDDHFPSISFLERLLVTTRLNYHHSVIRKAVFPLSIHHLIGTEPMTHLVQIIVEVFEEIAIVYTLISIPYYHLSAGCRRDLPHSHQVPSNPFLPDR